MIYKAIGLMSGSSLDGLDLVYTHLQETGGKWNFEIINADCYPYPKQWQEQLAEATQLSALNYQLLHIAYGHYIASQVNHFIQVNDLHHKVDLVASHGHTTFHVPAARMTAQLGDGAAIAAGTGLPVVSDLRAMDMAFGGQGAPIVPIGEKLLLNDYDLLLNLGGIANLSARTVDGYIAFDVCAANKVLNMLIGKEGKEYDEDGTGAAAGKIDPSLLNALDNFDYYRKPYPKSLANDFGIDIIFPFVETFSLRTNDALCTYVEHIVVQIRNSISSLLADSRLQISQSASHRLLVTGGGALNSFMVSRLRHLLSEIMVEVIVPERNLVNYKEAVIMALIGVLRWREEYNILSSVTGAARSSIGGALWLGVEA